MFPKLKNSVNFAAFYGHLIIFEMLLAQINQIKSQIDLSHKIRNILRKRERDVCLPEVSISSSVFTKGL